MAQHADWTDVESLDPSRNESTLDLFGILWRRKWIVACVTVIAAALGYLYFLQATRIYRSVAQVLLIKKDQNISLVGDSNREFGGYGYGYENTLSTHMLLICSPKIVDKAVQDYHLGSLASLKGMGDPTSAIIAGMKAMRAGDRNTPDPNVMLLWFEGVDPRECGQVLSAVIDTYQKFLGDTFQNISEETVQLITQAKDVLNKQLTEKEEAYKQFRQESPLMWRGAEAANPHQTRMDEIERARGQVVVEITQIRARIEAIENAIKAGGNREALALLAAKARSDGGQGARTPREAFEEKLFLAMLDEQELLEEYGPDHPRVKAMGKRLDLLREHLGNMPLPEGADTSDFVQVYVESLRHELKMGEERLAEFDALFNQEAKAAKDLARFHLQDESMKNDIARTKAMFDSVLKRLEEINLKKDYGGVSTQVISAPSLGMLVRPKIALVLGLAAFLGIVAGFGLGYLVDVADKSFRSPEEIRRQLGIPVVGHIPLIESSRSKRSKKNVDPSKAPLDPVLCTYHNPKGRPAEAYRAVRTSLYFSTHGDGHKVIQVTSPNPGDGKTTLAANLAVAMADSGKRVLLMEADFRRPRVHKYFALDNTVGVSSIIAGEAEIPDVLQQTAVKNLWAMPCGPRPNNPSDLLTSPRFKELIDVVRDNYDFVLIDTPPILAVTDSSVVAPRVDAVLLVVRLTKHARDGAVRATEMLGGLGARVLGVVVNGIGKTSSYGYGYGYQRYGSYRYGGYRYASYRYGYGGDSGYGGNVYYGDDEPEQRRPRPAAVESKTEAPKAVE